ncbi:MAG: deoxyribonuclease IV [Chloroflexi bacterium]|nr:deoxyribonuclease IV [Chloroflexota bacterium]
MASAITIGAHCSASGGLWTAAERAVAIEAEAVQLFGSSPRAWRQTQHKPEAFQRFRELSAEAGLAPAWLHGSYLVNLAAPSDQQYERSIDSVVNALTVAHEAGAAGLVLHTGSHREAGLEAVLPRVLMAIERIIDMTPDDATLALETSAGQGGTIGSFTDLGVILDAVRSPRLQVCVDTCHVFAAGHDLRSEDGVTEMVERFDEEIGLEHLAVVHANDSKGELGGNLDRHENIGDGEIGYDGFRAVLGSMAFTGKTFLLEVPGIENDGPDLENVQRLKAIRDEVAAAVQHPDARGA